MAKTKEEREEAKRVYEKWRLRLKLKPSEWKTLSRHYHIQRGVYPALPAGRKRSWIRSRRPTAMRERGERGLEVSGRALETLRKYGQKTFLREEPKPLEASPHALSALRQYGQRTVLMEERKPPEPSPEQQRAISTLRKYGERTVLREEPAPLPTSTYIGMEHIDMLLAAGREEEARTLARYLGREVPIREGHFILPPMAPPKIKVSPLIGSPDVYLRGRLGESVDYRPPDIILGEKYGAIERQIRAIYERGERVPYSLDYRPPDYPVKRLPSGYVYKLTPTQEKLVIALAMQLPPDLREKYISEEEMPVAEPTSLSYQMLKVGKKMEEAFWNIPIFVPPPFAKEPTFVKPFKQFEEPWKEAQQKYPLLEPPVHFTIGTPAPWNIAYNIAGTTAAFEAWISPDVPTISGEAIGFIMRRGRGPVHRTEWGTEKIPTAYWIGESFGEYVQAVGIAKLAGWIGAKTGVTKALKFSRAAKAVETLKRKLPSIKIGERMPAFIQKRFFPKEYATRLARPIEAAFSWEPSSIAKQLYGKELATRYVFETAESLHYLVPLKARTRELWLIYFKTAVPKETFSVLTRGASGWVRKELSIPYKPVSETFKPVKITGRKTTPFTETLIRAREAPARKVISGRFILEEVTKQVPKVTTPKTIVSAPKGVTKQVAATSLLKWVVPKVATWRHPLAKPEVPPTIYKVKKRVPSIYEMEQPYPESIEALSEEERNKYLLSLKELAEQMPKKEQREKPTLLTVALQRRVFEQLTAQKKDVIHPIFKPSIQITKPIVKQKPKYVPKAVQKPTSIQEQVSKAMQIPKQIQLQEQMQLAKATPLLMPPRAITEVPSVMRDEDWEGLGRRRAGPSAFARWFFKEHPIKTPSQVAKQIFGEQPKHEQPRKIKRKRKKKTPTVANYILGGK